MAITTMTRNNDIITTAAKAIATTTPATLTAPRPRSGLGQIVTPPPPATLANI
ncbi:hypothetical protein R80B4_02572 [Fibrobacteres bacterium R8-0-B4]